MTVNRAANIFPGFMIMLGLAPAHFTGRIDLSRPSWLGFTAFVGANLYPMDRWRCTHMKKAVDDGVDGRAAVKNCNAQAFMRLLGAAEPMPGNTRRSCLELDRA